MLYIKKSKNILKKQKKQKQKLFSKSCLLTDQTDQWLRLAERFTSNALLRCNLTDRKTLQSY